jgi:hypothetical protein
MVIHYTFENGETCSFEGKDANRRKSWRQAIDAAIAECSEREEVFDFDRVSVKEKR